MFYEQGYINNERTYVTLWTSHPPVLVDIQRKLYSGSIMTEYFTFNVTIPTSGIRVMTSAENLYIMIIAEVNSINTINTYPGETNQTMSNETSWEYYEVDYERKYFVINFGRLNQAILQQDVRGQSSFFTFVIIGLTGVQYLRNKVKAKVYSNMVQQNHEGAEGRTGDDNELQYSNGEGSMVEGTYFGGGNGSLQQFSRVDIIILTSVTVIIIVFASIITNFTVLLLFVLVPTAVMSSMKILIDWGHYIINFISTSLLASIIFSLHFIILYNLIKGLQYVLSHLMINNIAYIII